MHLEILFIFGITMSYNLKHFDPLEAAPCTKTGTSLVRTAAEASSWEDKLGSHREQHVLCQAFVSNNMIYFFSQPTDDNVIHIKENFGLDLWQ